jgi:hypothetical protein
VKHQGGAAWLLRMTWSAKMLSISMIRSGGLGEDGCCHTKKIIREESLPLAALCIAFRMW